MDQSIFVLIMMNFWTRTILLLSAVAAAAKTIHSTNTCVMYGECGGGRNCYYNGPAKPISSDPFKEELVKMCGVRYQQLNRTCCDGKQLNSFKQSSKYAYNLIGACPACWRNFLDFWCDFTCSPDQSTFVHPIDVSAPNNQVIEVDYYVSPRFGAGFFESCRSVKFGPNNAFAMELLGNGAGNYLDMMRFMGTPKPFGSPFKIGFPDLRDTYERLPNGIQPMNHSALECGSATAYKCSCVDCEASCPVLDDIPATEKGWTGWCRTGDLFHGCLTAGAFTGSVILFIALCTIAVRQFLSARRHLRVVLPDYSTDESIATATSYEQQFLTANTSSGDEEEEEDCSNDNSGNGGVAKQRLRTTTYETGRASDESWLRNNIFFDYENNQLRHHAFQEFLQLGFCKLGYLCARKPWWTIILSVLAVAVCSIGWYQQFAVETDPLRLWVDPSSQTAQEKRYFDEHFGPFYRVQQLILTTQNGSSIVRQTSVEQLFQLNREISKLIAVDDLNPATNQTLRLQDLCFQPLQDGNCMVQSLTGFWQDDSTQFHRSVQKANGSFAAALQRCVDTPTSCLPSFQQPINIDLVVGGLGIGEDVLNGRALIVTILLNNYLDAEKVRSVKIWEDRLVQYLLQKREYLVRSYGIKLSFNTEHSIEMEINRESYTDVPTVIISYLVMLAYVALALGKYRSCRRLAVDSKFTVAIGGIAIVLGSISAAVGLFSFTGQKVTMIIAEVIPFLVLAIGVDNIFIIVHQFERIKLEQMYQTGVISPPAERVALSIGRIGPSLMLSALSETLAFSLGTLVGMPAVKSFSMIAAMAVWIDFCLQITCFVAILTLDARRAESRRVDCIPCLKIGSLSHSNAFMSSAESNPLLRENSYMNTLRWEDDGFNCDNSEGILQTMVRKYYAPWLLRPSVKVLIAFGFFAAFLRALINVDQIELGLDQRIALPRDSYLIDYFDDLEQNLRVGPPVYFVAKNISLRTTRGQSAICSRFTGCSSQSLPNILEQERRRPELSFISQPAAGWFDDMMMWLNPAASDCCLLRNEDSIRLTSLSDKRPELCRPLEDIPVFDCHACLPSDDPLAYNNSLSGLPKEERFTEFLQLFLQSKPTAECSLGGSPYASAVSIRSEDVEASHFRTFHSLLRTQKDFIDAYRAARRIADSIQAKQNSEGNMLQVFPYSVFYVYFDQYARLPELLWTTIALELLAIVLIATLFMGNLRNALIMTAVVSMVVVDMVGFVMYYWQISLNAITLVNMLICVGITVEFCTHLTRAFTITPPQHPLFDIADGRVVFHNRWLTTMMQEQQQDGAEGSPYITGTRNRRAFVSLVEMGSSVLSGITLTKFCGILVLFYAQSRIFEVYYFRMYLGMILLGAVHSLMLLPILLSWFGSHNVSRLSSLATLAAKAGVGDDLTAAQGGSGFRPYSTVSNYVDSSIFDDETTMNNH